jgi:phage baseplate assembly protein W
MTLSFKNVGIRSDSTSENPLIKNKSVLPIGIRTPIQLSDGHLEMFVMNTTIREQIRDNLKNLLLTNHGERLAQYDFGANLKPILAEYYNQSAFDSEAMIRINTTISKYMPFVVPIEFESKNEYSERNKRTKVVIRIIYSIPNIQVSKDEIEITMLVI